MSCLQDININKHTQGIAMYLNERHAHQLQQFLAFVVMLWRHFNQSFLKLLNVLGLL